jgi:hypothetical protein
MYTDILYLFMTVIQMMTFHEVNTGIDQPMEHDIDRGIRGLINPCIHRNYHFR